MENKNYSGIYHKSKANGEVDYKGFFEKYALDSKELKKIKSEIKKLTDQLAEKNYEYSVLNNKRFNEEFCPVGITRYFCYTDKNRKSYFFDLESGVPVDPEENEDKGYQCINLTGKKGNVTFTTGYAFSLGALVVRKYNYQVASNNLRVSLTLETEYLYPVVDGRQAVLVTNHATGSTYEETGRTSFFIQYLERSIDAGEFICKFYGIEERKFEFSLRDMAEFYCDHPSMETLIRQTKDNSTLRKLLSLEDKEFCPSVYQYIGVTKSDYKELESKGIITDFIQLRNTLLRAEEYHSTNKDTLQKIKSKTVSEWISFILKSKGWEEDFNFYRITYRDGGILSQLVDVFCHSSRDWRAPSFHNFADHYSFGDFCSYCIEGCINQGYTNLNDFCRELADYIKMCVDSQVSPTLYSGYLRQTHDIISRNYQIKLSQEQEEEFKVKYSDFEPWISKDKKYTVMAPKNAEEVKRVASELNNCLSSYIDKIIKGSCKILFFRSMINIEKTIIAIELREGKMVQVKRSHNRDYNAEDEMYLRECCAAKKWGFEA